MKVGRARSSQAFIITPIMTLDARNIIRCHRLLTRNLLNMARNPKVRK